MADCTTLDSSQTGRFIFKLHVVAQDRKSCSNVHFEQRLSGNTVRQSKRSLSELVNVIAWYTECELVCKLAKLSALRRDSVSRLSRGCVTERNWLPSNMSHVFARVRDVLIEFTVNTNLPFCTTKSFQLLEIWTNPTIREAAFRSLAQTHHDSRHWPRLCTWEFEPRFSPASNHSCCEGLLSFPISSAVAPTNSLIKFAITSLEVQAIANNSQTVRIHISSVSEKPTERSMLDVNEPNWTFYQAILCWIDGQYTPEEPKFRTHFSWIDTFEVNF